MSAFDEAVEAAADAMRVRWYDSTVEEKAAAAVRAAFDALTPIAWLHESTKTIYDRRSDGCDLCVPLYRLPKGTP